MSSSRAGEFALVVSALRRYLRLTPLMYGEVERAAYSLRGSGGNGRLPLAESDPTGSTAVDYAREQGTGLSVVGELRASLERMDTYAGKMVVNLDQIVGAYLAARDLMSVELPTLHSTWSEADFLAAEERAARRVRRPVLGPHSSQDRSRGSGEALHRPELSTAR